MAFQPIQQLSNIHSEQNLANIPGLEYCAIFLKEAIGLEGDLVGIDSLIVNENGGLLMLHLDPYQNLHFDVPSEGVIFIWVFPVPQTDQAHCIVFWRASEGFDFKEAYNLSTKSDSNLPFHEKSFWSSAWVFFSQVENKILPLEVIDMMREDFINHPQIVNNIFTLNFGLNLLHKWDAGSYFDEFNLESFASFFGEPELLLSVKEQLDGMIFTTYVNSITNPLAPYLDKFLKVESLEFSIFKSFNDQISSSTSAKISAEVSFMDEPCLLEANIPLHSNENSVISLEIYPKGNFKLLKEASETESLTPFLTRLGIDYEVPNIFPKVNLSLPFIKLYLRNNAIDRFSTKLLLHLEDGDQDSGYEVVEDLFTIYDISIQLEWLKGRGIGFTVSGAMQALSYDFHLSFAYPTYTIEAELAPGVSTEKSIEKLASELGVPEQVGKGLAAVGTAFDISMFADVDDKRLEINLKNHEEWTFAKFVKLTKFNLQFEFFQNWSFSGASVFTQMALPIGKKEGSDRKEVHINIFAGFERAGNLWTFEGSTGVGEEIPVGEAIGALLGKITGSSPTETLPEAINKLKVRNISLYFDSDGNADFVCETVMEIEGYEVDFWVHLLRENKTLKFAGSIFINGIQLAVAFSSGNGAKDVMGSLIFPMNMDTKDIVGALAPGMEESIRINVGVELNGLLIAMHVGAEAKSQKEYLFRLSFNLNFDLGGFPLIGSMLKDIKFSDGQVIVANKDWENDAVGNLNGLMNLIQPVQPKALAQPKQSDEKVGVNKGISLSGTFNITENLGFPLFLNFGGQTKPRKKLGEGSEPIKGDGKGEKEKKPAPSKSGKPDTRSQSKVNKVFSAVKIKKVSLIFQEGRLGLKLTGGLSLAAFEFELMGLQLTVPQSILNNPADITGIEFDLDGFGAAIQKGPLSIMGGFMRIKHPTEQDKLDGKTQKYNEYAGVVQVQLTKFGLAGLGSYAEFPDEHGEMHTSLFLFVALSFPIPLHPSLLITGMSLGFGIHRDAIAPKLEDVLTYPLVQMAITPPPPMDIEQILSSMGKYFPPTADQYFVVAGIKFKAFSLVDTLAMLLVKFGRSFEIQLIGVSSVFFPKAAFIELAWMARFVPDTGYLFIGGQLTNRSFLLIPQVQLTGGFAVAAWMKSPHAGDFVVSVGGYHPRFKVPAHYPKHIPRLGISFYLDPVTIKGGVYFAITPQCLMMGGFLDASLDEGWIEAHLKIHMDAIIHFEPFHYDVTVGVDAGVKATIGYKWFSKTFNLHLHIDCHLWGPEFSGTASLDVGPKTFEVEFGAGSSTRAIPIGWKQFKKKFLQSEKDKNFKVEKDEKLQKKIDTYHNSKACTASVTKGLLQKVKDGSEEIYVIDPKLVEIEVKSLIPITDGQKSSVLGIAPMDIRGSVFSSELNVDNAGKLSVESIEDSLPKGIWGHEGLKKVNISEVKDMLIPKIKTGSLYKAPKDKETGESHEMNKENFKYNTDFFELTDKISTLKMTGKSKDNDFSKKPVDSFSFFTGLDDSELALIKSDELLHKNLVECEFG